jgi:hypothetical protein
MMGTSPIDEMPGRDLVQRAVHFRGPDRVPRDLPEPWGTDFFHIGISPDPDWKPSVPGEDEWGCVWRKVSPDDKTMGQVKVHPLEDYSKLDSFRFPSYDIPERYLNLEETVKENTDDRFVLTGVPISLITRLDYLRGNRNAMADPYRHPDELKALLGRMTDIAIDSLEHLAPLGVDGIISPDDWGLQDRSMISPAIFREFFKPFYKRMYHRAHEHGMITFLHSCGHISELLDDMIEAELDVINMDQQQNMGVDYLADNFGGRICFWCPVDIQKMMVRGSLEDIRGYARKLIERFGAYNGGFMCKWYGSPDAIAHTQEKIRAMSEAFVKYGSYS